MCDHRPESPKTNKIARENKTREREVNNEGPQQSTYNNLAWEVDITMMRLILQPLF